MDYRSAADYLKLLAHPTRLRIVAALCNGERCVSNLENLLELKQANVSQHLSILTRAGLLASRRDGMRICYRLSDEKVVKILEMLDVEMDPAAWECTSDRSE